MNNKLISAAEAVKKIKSSDTITIAGFVGTGVPDELLNALKDRFLKENTPNNLTLLFSAGPGDGDVRGINLLAFPKLLKRVVGGHFGLIPRISELALNDEIEAYNIPQGIISHLYRDIASGKPGVFTKVGLGTFADPRIEGGKVNKSSKENLIELINIKEEEYLFIPTFPLDIAILRGSVADKNGSISMRNEALIIDNLAQAMAVKNSGGTVIVQVEQVIQELLPSRQVDIPSGLVDFIVVGKADNHLQTYACRYSNYLDGSKRKIDWENSQHALDQKKIIARRAFLELTDSKQIVNLGIGTPEVIAEVAKEENQIDKLILTTEAGVHGGLPSGGLSFGTAVNTDAIISQNQQFDFYDGGGIHTAFLGMAQIDKMGNVNVSRFSGRLAGAGGFVNISSSSENIVFCGTFTSGGLKLQVEDEKINILNEGKIIKFTNKVDQITFSGERAETSGQSVKYVTERAVFELKEGKVHLIEIAPGIDLEKQILAFMDFEPLIDKISIMDPRIFSSTSMMPAE